MRAVMPGWQDANEGAQWACVTAEGTPPGGAPAEDRLTNDWYSPLVPRVTTYVATEDPLTRSLARLATRESGLCER